MDPSWPSAAQANNLDLRYGSWTGACGPSWSCRVSHPHAGPDELMRVVFGGTTLQIQTPLASGAGTWAQLCPRSNLEHIWDGLGLITEAGRELADPAGVAALAIRRM